MLSACDHSSLIWVMSTLLCCRV